MTEPPRTADAATASRRRRAFRFVLLMGLVSLLADMCYEGMRSAIGPYLALLGASSTAVGFVAGLGEFVGYGLRYLTGRLADRTGHYWALTIAGYAINLIAVPALALAGHWWTVAALVALERLGKAVRSPARSTLLSFAAEEIGQGKSFAIHELLDQVGGVAGPLVITAVLLVAGDGIHGHRWAFAALAVPAVANLAVLLIARRRVPDPRHLAPQKPPAAPGTGMGAAYWTYVAGVALIAAGLADWALVSYHLEVTHAAPTALLPIVYAAAMAADAVAALVAGWLFDRSRDRGGRGTGVVAGAAVIAAGFAPLVFTGGAVLPFVGVALWAFGLAATESVAKATIATLVSPERRGRAYGAYYAVFGAAWWLGSLAIGALYARSPAAAAAFCSGCLLAGAAVLAISGRARRAN